MPVKMENTATMMSAALVTTPALVEMPTVMASVVVSPRCRDSAAGYLDDGLTHRGVGRERRARRPGDDRLAVVAGGHGSRAGCRS